MPASEMPGSALRCFEWPVRDLPRGVKTLRPSRVLLCDWANFPVCRKDAEAMLNTDPESVIPIRPNLGLMRQLGPGFRIDAAQNVPTSKSESFSSSSLVP